MRKILSKEELEKKQKKNTFIISGFMLVVLVLGTVGYAVLYSGSQDNKNNQNSNSGFVGNRWTTTINNEVFSFSNSPDDVKNISVGGFFALESFAGKPLYIASDSGAITSEIASTLGRFSSRVQEACYGSCEKDLPEKNCSENLLVWQDSLESKVYQEENCVFIQGDLKIVDAFLFKVLKLQ